MRIIQPSATLLTGLIGSLSFIESAARVSHRSEDLQTATPERFIETVVLGHGDWSVVEHVSASVEFIVDRGITHEIVRHRHFSYTQESTRFVNYAKKMPPAFIYPQVGVECPHCLAGNSPQPQGESINDTHTTAWLHGRDFCPYEPCWLYAIRTAEDEYRNLLDSTWRPQEARSVFPNALAAKLIMTGNLRAWRHFLRMRTTKETHPQLRQVTIPLLEQFKAQVPLLFDDIVSLNRQIDNLKLPA